MVVRTDVYEVDGQIVVVAELPGLDPSRLEITVGEGVLAIRGKPGAASDESLRRYHRRERSPDGFERFVPLPVPVCREDVRAALRNGLLTVTIPACDSNECGPIGVDVE